MKAKHFVLLALGAALSLAVRAGTPFYRVPITVAEDALAAGTVLTNFPVLVRISEGGMPGFRYSSSMAPDAEVVFSSDPSGAYPFSYEIDTWNSGGESLVWAKVPELTNGASFYFLYYYLGNPNPPANDPTDVWSADYIGVWHLNEGPGAAVAADSTGHGLVATPQTAAIKVDGPVGAARGDAVFKQPNFVSTHGGSTAFTLSGWYDLRGAASPATTFMYGSWAVGGFYVEKRSATVLRLISHSSYYDASACNALAEGFTHLEVCGTPTSIGMYANGAATALKSFSVTAKVATCADFQMMNAGVRADEIRYRGVTSSPAWRKAEYDSMARNDFLACGAVEMVTPPDVLGISGVPFNIGVIVPGYGMTNGLIAGSSFVCSASNGVANAAGYAGTCTGYKLYKVVSGVRTLVDEGAGASFTYTHADTMRELVWQWGDLRVQVTATAAEGGSVAFAQGGTSRLFATNDVAVVTAMPGVGSGFYKWTGDVPEAQQFDNPLYLNVGETPLHITAVFSSGRYVTPEGAGAKTGESWENAFATVQDAIDASATGGTIYLAGGVFTNAQSDAAEPSLCVVTNIARLVFRGGYAGSGTPGERGSARSVIHNLSGSRRRILRAVNAELLFDGVDAEGGYVYTNENFYGAGFNLQNCETTLTNCNFHNNMCYSTSGGYKRFNGGGVYVSGGSLMALDCNFTNNVVRSTADNHNQYGGGFYATGATSFEFKRCRFGWNYAMSPYKTSLGGAICAEGCGIGVIDECAFVTNHVYKNRTYASGTPYGGAIYASDIGKLHMRDTFFAGNYALSPPARGGTFYLTDANANNGMMATIVEQCAIVASCSSDSNSNGEMALTGGYLFATNVLYGGNTAGNAISVFGGTADFTRATIAGAQGYGAQIRVGGAVCTIRDSILAGNLLGNFMDGPIATGSISDAPLEGTGNTVATLHLATDGYYHPLSRAGYYTGGFFGGGTWTTADVTCPSIDAGAESEPCGDELQPNGHRFNLGYDAGLAVASKSDLGNPPVAAGLTVYAYAATNITAETACASAEITGTGGVAAEVFVVWGAADGGTNSPSAWDRSASVGTKEDWDLFSTTIENVADNTYYRFYTTRGGATLWSDPVQSYKRARLATFTDGGVSHLTRHEATFNITLLDDGDSATTMTAYYWPDGAEEYASNGFGEIGLGAASLRVSGLAAGTLYHYRIEAQNNAGISTAEGSFTTVTDLPAVCYVTQDGAGAADGTSWANAFSNLQDAVDFSCCAGDVIYLKSGVHLRPQPVLGETAHYIVTNRPGVAFRGGYLGEGAPGALVAERTVIRRGPAESHILMRASQSGLTFDNIDLEDGYGPSATFNGAALNLVNCKTVITNCNFYNNRLGGGNHYGGAIHVTGGTLTVTDVTLRDNACNYNGDNSSMHGGVIYASGATSVDLARCWFDRNQASSYYKTSQGGALYFSACGNVLIDQCLFTTNFISKHETHTGTSSAGGTLYANDLRRLHVRDSRFVGAYTIGIYGVGGVFCLADTNTKNGMMTTIVERCSFSFSGIENKTNARADMRHQSGHLFMTNVIYGVNVVGDGLVVTGGEATLANATITGAMGCGVTVSGGTCTLKNSIVWGNALGGVNVAGGTFAATYTCSQELLDGAGNRSADPLFKNAGAFDYHITYDSPCRNAGDKTGFQKSDLDLDGNRRVFGQAIDLGCYERLDFGNTIILR